MSSKPPESTTSARGPGGDPGFREIVAHSPDLIFINHNDRITYINPAGVAMLRGQSEQDFLGRSVFDLFHPDSHEVIRQRVAMLRQGARGAPMIQKKLVALNGDVIDAEVYACSYEVDGQLDIQVVCRDITERIAIERAQRERLSKNEALTRIAGKLARVGGWSMTVPAHKVFWSDEVYTILDYPRDRTPSIDTELDLYPVEWRDQITSALGRCEREGTPFEVEIQMFTGARRRIWVRVAGEAERDDRGVIRSIHGAFTDVTAQKAADEHLRELASRLFNTVESITDAFFTVDHAWRFTYLNAEAERLLEQSRTSLLGRNLWEAFPEAVGSDSDREYHRAASEGTSVAFETYYPPLRKWFDVRAYPSRDGLAVYFRDVTEKRAAAEQLAEQAALLDKARDAIVVRNLDHTIRFWNQSAERLYGWTKAQAMGRSIKELIYRDPTDFLVATDITITKGEWAGELRQVTQAGNEIIAEGRWSLVRDARGNPKAILAATTDITDRKKLEQQFFRAQRMESLGTLAGGIAHDLNNMLTPIMMSVDLLKSRIEDPRALDLLEIISTSTRRGADMVSQVLSFARGMDGRRAEVKIQHLINDLVKIITDTFPKSIRITTRVNPEVSSLYADPTQLHQVLLNLCVNARDALPDGGEIILSAENVVFDEHYAAMNVEARVGPYVKIEIEDNGTGIPRDMIERIFDPFFTTKAVGSGTGLGLSTAMGIIKGHGGFIRVYSEIDSGTRFRIYIPASSLEAPSPESDAPTGIPRGNGETVLVVDDEVSVRQITKQTLEAFGYRVLLASDGAEAVSVYAAQISEVNVVIMDMMMPVMDGPTTIKVFRRLNPKVRIIAASGIGTNGRIARTAELGVEHFLPKPYTGETLLRMVHTVLSIEA